MVSQPIEPVVESAAPSAAPRAFGSKKPNFSSLENDVDLIHLMSRYPDLRIQLQSIYGLTLEPPPPDPADQQDGFSSFRGRGRGRGRGGWRGRGRYGHTNQQPRQSQWNQAKGDKEAGDAFKRMRDREGDTEGLAEFVKLITMKFGKAGEDTGAVE